MAVGTVKFYCINKGYGFIKPEDGGQNTFVHASAVRKAGMTALVRNQRIFFERSRDDQGKVSAINLRNA